MVAIGVTIFRNESLNMVRQRVSHAMDKCPWLDNVSRSDIMGEAIAVAKRCLLVDKKKLPKYVAYNAEEVMKAWNRAYKRAWARTKKTNVLSYMKLQRSRDNPVVFYLVSSHQKPQKAHKDLQGKILVDHFWKNTLGDDWRVPSVGKFIKNNDIRTVQWAIGAPHYLCTRPNCKHVLIPVSIGDILTMNLKDVNKKYQKQKPSVHRPITDQQRWQDFLQLRADILDSLERKLL